MKRADLARVKSEVEMDLMRRIKASLDPKGILNPGQGAVRGCVRLAVGGVRLRQVAARSRPILGVIASIAFFLGFAALSFETCSQLDAADVASVSAPINVSTRPIAAWARSPDRLNPRAPCPAYHAATPLTEGRSMEASRL